MIFLLETLERGWGIDRTAAPASRTGYGAWDFTAWMRSSFELSRGDFLFGNFTIK
jgi:hypothetical protein